jgi:uncharacterized protein YkwD
VPTVAGKTFALAITLAGLLLAAPAGATVDAPAGRVVALHSLEAQLLVDVNALRVRRGLEPLSPSASLGAAAESHSLEMARRGFFAHDSADGSRFSTRIRRFYGPGRRFWSVGENLLWGSPDVDPWAALHQWMESPAHRANLLQPRWREVGLSAIHVAAGRGVFGPGPATVVTADFGARG